MLFLVMVLLVGAIFPSNISILKKKNKWFGLILPAITFLYSLLMIFGIAVFGGNDGW